MPPFDSPLGAVPPPNLCYERRYGRPRCRDHRRPRIGEVAARRLIEKSDGSDASPTVETAADAEGLVLALDGETHRLDRGTAITLRDDLADALVARREFLRTAGKHRPDGSYVVERRAADSEGHSKVFERFAALRRLYDRLPAEFTADAVGRTGLTGGRRHLLVRHLAEHPAFDCELVARQPLTARKRDRERAVER